MTDASPAVITPRDGQQSKASPRPSGLGTIAERPPARCAVGGKRSLPGLRAWAPLRGFVVVGGEQAVAGLSQAFRPGHHCGRAERPEAHPEHLGGSPRPSGLGSIAGGSHSCRARMSAPSSPRALRAWPGLHCGWTMNPWPGFGPDTTSTVTPAFVAAVVTAWHQQLLRRHGWRSHARHR